FSNNRWNCLISLLSPFSDGLRKSFRRSTVSSANFRADDRSLSGFWRYFERGRVMLNMNSHTTIATRKLPFSIEARRLAAEDDIALLDVDNSSKVATMAGNTSTNVWTESCLSMNLVSHRRRRRLF
ncbi:unnamed protein product, partial [Acanthoscelides obtectus]